MALGPRTGLGQPGTPGSLGNCGVIKGRQFCGKFVAHLPQTAWAGGFVA
jgi:hypothetical protein